MSLHYIKCKTKAVSYFKKNNPLFAVFFSLIFIFLYVINIALYSLISLINNFIYKDSKGDTLIFIEPYKQGFGDLFYQTALFEFLEKNNKRVVVVCRKKHIPIINNNTFIKCIYKYSITDVLKLTLREKGTLIVLGRSTLYENIIALLNIRKKIIFLDKDLNMWTDYLKKYERPLFWQKIIQNILAIESNHYFSPHIDIKDIKENKYEICIVAGVQDNSKFFDFTKVISALDKRKNVVLVGRTKNKFIKNYNKEGVLNTVNRKSYIEGLEIVKNSQIIIGSEGSIVQIALSMGKPVYVVSGWDRLLDNCDKNYLKNAIKVDPELNLIKNIR